MGNRNTHVGNTQDALADQLIVVRCQLGERDAFDALVRRWSTPLLHHAMKFARDRDQANDLVQDIWLRVLRNLPSLRQSERFRAWLFGIAHRVLMDRLRTQYGNREVADVDAMSAMATEDDDASLGLDIEAGLAALPLMEREVITLFHLEQLTLAEIALALQVPVGTVKSRLFRARALLRAHFRNEETNHASA